MIKQLGAGLLLLAEQGYNQMSIMDNTKIYAGDNEVSEKLAKELYLLNWRFDDEYDSWCFNTVDEDG